MRRRIIVTGTGTEIGKTHVADAMLRRLARALRAAGVKPVESGLQSGGITDAVRLAAATMFHVKHAGYAFEPALSPHLAARQAGTAIDARRVRSAVNDAEADLDVIVIELPGGMFTPLSETLLNADVICDLAPARVALLVPDRLGALHDTIATALAARATGTPIDAVLVNTPNAIDSSSGTNTPELRRLLPGMAIFGPLPRAPSETLARHPELEAALDHLLAGWPAVAEAR